MAGHGMAWQGRAWHGRAGQGRAGQGRAGQGRAVKKHTLHLNLACKKKKRKSQYRKSSEGKNHQYKSTRRLGVLLLLTCLCTQSPCCVNLYAIKKYYNGSINGLNWFEPWVRTGRTMVQFTSSYHGSNRFEPFEPFERFEPWFDTPVSDLDQRVRTGSNPIRTHGSKWFQWQNRVEIGFEPLEKWVRTVFEPIGT